jgi:hypothetical protein
MFAAPVDMEPGMHFRTHATGPALEWLGVEAVLSRFANKRRVRVLVRRGESFIVDAGTRFMVISWERR